LNSGEGPASFEEDGVLCGCPEMEAEEASQRGEVRGLA